MVNKSKDEDVDLIDWARKVWIRRKFIGLVSAVFLIFGVIYSLIAPARFDSGTIFITQSNEKSKVPGGLGGIASLAGVDLSFADNATEIPPTLYSKMANSVPFLRKLVKSPLTLTNGDVVTYEQYYDSIHEKGILDKIVQYTVGLPSLLKSSGKETTNANKKNDWLKLTQAEKADFDRLQGQLSIGVNQQGGYISLMFSMEKPALSAQMANSAFSLLQQELIDYKTQKAQESFNFTYESYKKKEKEFFEIQNKLALFKDANKNISSSRARNELDRLQAQYDLKFRLYSELASQVEQTRLDLNLEKPVFFVIQPISEPLLRTSPKRKVIVIVSLLIGLLIATFFVLIQNTLAETWKKIRTPRSLDA